MLKTIVGTVLSAKMQNTVVVRVVRKLRHPVYKKVVTKHRKFKVHNTLKDIHEGDEVVIQETTPISKEKHFKVIEKVTKK
ncbi:30S ribosomal protein S17 [Candidatus Woesebacteria bacterium]|nr:30S ribosomal protein S17 [Candidatus Woesebacteria bacterium]